MQPSKIQPRSTQPRSTQPRNINPRTVVAIYFLFQAVGVAAWWLLLWLHPPAIDWFQPSDLPHDALGSFWLADLLCLVLGSLIASIGIAKGSGWASTAVWAVTAATWYPSLYCLASSVRTDQAWLASAMMFAMAGMALAMATVNGNANQSPAAIRATTMTKTEALVWTIAQVGIFWSIFLWIFPKGIVECEQLLGWPAFHHSGQELFSLGLFCLGSALGLWSGVSMALRGDGTPLPTATAPTLVLAGPYRFVRNPMAVAGITQGVAVGWYFGSIAVVVYALSGALIWHLFVRPIEERDLSERFGDAYAEYRGRVGLWIPVLGNSRDSGVP